MFLLSLLFFLSINIAFSSNYLHLSGWVVHNDKALPNATIDVFDGDSLIHTMKSNYLGSFSVFLPFQKEFKFLFSKRDMITKTVTIDTRTPEEPDPEYYYFFRFEVELFEDNPYARREFFNDPVAIIYFDIGIEEFRFHRNNVKVHSTKARGKQAAEEQVWPFEDPESFFTYLQETIANPEQVNIIADLPAAEVQSASQPMEQQVPAEVAVQEEQENQVEEKEPIYAEYLPQQETAKPDPTEEMQNSVSYPDENNKEGSLHAEITPEELDTQIPKAEKTDPEDFLITFYDYRNASVEVEPQQEVFFSVQLLATVKRIPRGFFDRFLNNFPDAGILFYHDQDELDKYITGVYSSLEQAFEKHRQLRETGIEAYIVAFYGNRRISVKQALTLLP